MNLRRRRLRAAFGVAGAVFRAAAIVTVPAVVTVGIGMFQRIPSAGTQCLLFERNVPGLLSSPKQTNEPTGAFDGENGTVVHALVKPIAERDGASVVIAAHEHRFAKLSHRRMRMHNGRSEEM